ncbi:hypothetical protein CWI38_0915p0020 [Hamiltosporidium tvaerminnensis]|uniref:Fam-c protein n=1 Tax=Hamiltosporidium tvaerminnensis TaxID=1176355 RepID=A0A4Q9LWN3_9MICR|nr:hypothetical protein CWI37_0060p0030 [Hamiltosporidium tvaerminnensis]TBU12060.1 hypothetical protein CWI38_0915p0020 [Hamiltosporidium tvaerminnensis]
MKLFFGFLIFFNFLVDNIFCAISKNDDNDALLAKTSSYVSIDEEREDITDSKKYLGNKDTESEDEQAGCFGCCWSKKKKPSKTKNEYKESDQGSFQTYRRAASFDDIDLG